MKIYIIIKMEFILKLKELNYLEVMPVELLDGVKKMELDIGL